jgi:hypothetical protein
MVEFQRYYDKFLERIDNVPLKRYWSIPYKNSESLDILYSQYVTDITTDEKHIIFSVHYSKTYSYDFIGVPKEVSNLINEYARDDMDLIFRIIYPENFPFQYPTWTVEKIGYNIRDTSPTIRNTIQEIVDRHNCNYQSYWSPVIRIEIDFLAVFIEIQKIFIFQPSYNIFYNFLS